MVTLNTNETILNITLKSYTGHKIFATYIKNNVDKAAPAALIVPAINYHDPLSLQQKDKAIEIAADVFAKNGFSVLIVYIGDPSRKDVLDSQDKSFVELQNISFAFNWLIDQNKDAFYFSIISISSAFPISANLVMRRPEVECFLSISLLLKDKKNFSFLSPTPCDTFLIHGDADVVSKYSDTIKVGNYLSEQNLHEIKINIIKDGDHGCHNKLKELEQSIDSYVKYKLATRVAKKVKKKRRKRDKKKKID